MEKLFADHPDAPFLRGFLFDGSLGSPSAARRHGPACPRAGAASRQLHKFGSIVLRKLVGRRFEIKFNGFPDVPQRLFTCFPLGPTALERWATRDEITILTTLQYHLDSHAPTLSPKFTKSTLPTLSSRATLLWVLRRVRFRSNYHDTTSSFSASPHHILVDLVDLGVEPSFPAGRCATLRYFLYPCTAEWRLRILWPTQRVLYLAIQASSNPAGRGSCP